MRQRLAQLFQVPVDVDYVGAFQALADLNVEMRGKGPTLELLLRRSLAERSVGNHEASLRCAKDAALLAPDNPEVHYEVGLAFMFLALAKAQAIPIGPRVPTLPEEGVGELLGLAVEQFSRVLELNPNDEDVAADLAALAEVLAQGADDSTLGRALRER